MQSLIYAIERLIQAFRSAPRLDAASQALIGKLQNALADGEWRIVAASSGYLCTAWPHMNPEEFFGASDWGEKHIDNSDLERDFWEEVRVLSECVSAQDPPPAEGGPLSKIDHASFVRKVAIDQWMAYGVPYRPIGDNVARIDAPRMVHGSPVIKQWPIREFLVELAKQSAADCYRKWQLEVQRNVWMTLAIAAFVAAIISLRR
jgi:hypothetical protein